MTKRKNEFLESLDDYDDYEIHMLRREEYRRWWLYDATLEEKKGGPVLIPYPIVSTYATKQVCQLWPVTLNAFCYPSFVEDALRKYFPPMFPDAYDLVAEFVTFKHPRNVARRKAVEAALREVHRAKRLKSSSSTSKAQS